MQIVSSITYVSLFLPQNKNIKKVIWLFLSQLGLCYLKFWELQDILRILTFSILRLHVKRSLDLEILEITSHNSFL